MIIRFYICYIHAYLIITIVSASILSLHCIGALNLYQRPFSMFLCHGSIVTYRLDEKMLSFFKNSFTVRVFVYLCKSPILCSSRLHLAANYGTCRLYLYRRDVRGKFHYAGKTSFPPAFTAPSLVSRKK